MLRLTFVLFVVGSFAMTAQESSQLNWLTNLEEAQKISKKEKKPILAYFTGSDWCAPCKQLKADFFDSTSFADKASDFVLLYVDYPRRLDIITEQQLSYNKELIKEYNPQKSFPTLVIISSKGKKKDEISGYGSLRDTRYHFEFLERNK